MAELRCSPRVVALPGGVVIHIVYHHEIEPAVAVDVDEAGRRGPLRIVEACFRGDILERAVAVIEKQLDATVLRDQHVDEAVVIEVADGDSHVVPGNVETRAGTDVGETPVLLLMIELIPGRRI